MTNWGIYARQSLDVSEGIARQIARCRTLIAARGGEVTEIFEDNDVSASKARGASSAWGQMLAAVRAGKIDTIVAVDMDRLLRSMRDLVTLSDVGARVVTVDGQIDLTTADGAFRAQMLAAIAEFEVKRKAERQRRSNADRVERRGLPVPGKRRFGFEPGNIEERPAEGERVRWLYGQVLDGASIFSLAKTLDKPPVRVREILTNPSYAGWVVRRGEKFEAADAVSRIVDREVWESVQAVLRAPGRRTSPGNQIKFAASGIARCGVEGCGARLVKQGVNYLCKGNLSHVCINAQMLDDHLAQHALQYIARRDAAAEPEELRALVQRLAEAQTRRARFQEMASWDGADLADLKRKIAEAGRDIANLEEAVSNLRSATATDTAMDTFFNYLADIAVYDEAGTATIEFDSDEWVDIWNEVPLDMRRDVLSNLNIIVNKGRGLGRVSVKPKKGLS